MADNNSSLHVELKATDNISKAVKSAQSSIIRFVGAVTSAIVSLKAISFPVESSAQFERALADVAKTTNFTALEMEGLSDSLIDMSKNMSLTALELANIAATAGQLGLGGKGVEAIEQFTESVARATVTFGLGEEQVSQYAAQILQIFNIPTSKVENLFSQVNELSNNSVASAEYLLDVMRRVGSIAGLTSEDVGALAASTADFGVTAEVAGTTLVKIFSNMETKASDFARVLNTTTQDWATSVEAAPLQAFKRVTEAIAQLDSQSKATAIRDLFGSGRIFSLAAKFVNDASNEFDTLNKNVGNSESAFASGTSSIEEYEKVVVSLTEQLKITKNSFTALAIESGEKLLPKLKEIAKELQEFLDSQAAKDAFEALINSIGSLITAIQSGIKTLAEYSDLWRNLIPIIKIFLALAVGNVILHIVDGLGAASVKLLALTSSWKSATVAMREYYAKSLTSRSKAEIAEKRATTQGPARAAEERRRAEIGSLRGEIAENRILVKQNSKLIAQENQRVYLAKQRMKVLTGAGPLSEQGRQALKNIRDETAARLNNIRVLRQERKEAKKNIAQIIVKDLNEQYDVPLRNARVYGTEKKAADALTKSKTRLAAASAKLRNAVVPATQALKGLGFALKATGSIFSKVLFGPIGTIASLFFIFKDELLSFFGFVTNEGEKAAKAAARRSQEQMETYAKTLVASYQKIAKEFKNSLSFSANKDLFSTRPTTNLDEILEVEGVDKYNEKLEETTSRYAELSKAVAGGEVELNTTSSAFAKARVDVNRYNEEIRKLETEIAAKKEKRGAFTGSSIAARSVSEEISELTAKLKTVRKQAQQAEDVAGELEAALKRTETVNANIQRERIAAADNLLSQYTESDAAFIKIKAQQLQQIDALKELNDRKEQLLALVDNTRGRNKNKSRYTAAVEELEQLNSETLNLERSLTKTTKTLLEARQANSNTETEKSNKADIDKTNSLEAILLLEQRIGSAQLKNAQQNDAALYDQLSSSVRQLSANEKLSNSFAVLSGNLRRSIESAKSVYANIDSITTAASKATRQLIRDLEGLVESQDADAATKQAFANIDKAAEESFSIQRDYYERLIKYRESIGDTAGASRAEEDLALLEQQNTQAVQQEKNVLKLTKAKEKFAKLEKDINDLVKEQGNLQQQTSITAEELDEESIKQYGKLYKDLTEERQRSLEVSLREQNLLTFEKNIEELKKLEKEIASTSEAVISLGNATDIDPTTGTLTEKLIPESERKALLERAESLSSQLNDALTANIAGSGKAATATELFLNDITKQFGDTSSFLNTQIAGLTKALGLSEQELGSLRVAWNNATDVLTAPLEDNDYAKIAELLKKQAQVATAINEAAKLSVDGSVAFDTQTLVTGLDLLKRQNDITQEQIVEIRKDADKSLETLNLIKSARESFISALTERVTSENDGFVSPASVNAQLVAAIESFNNNPANRVTPTFELDTTEAEAKLDKIADAFNTKLNVEITATPVEQRARGGYIRGKGTTTSDSIPALLSDKEYVIRAAAVSKFGVGFFDMLNSLKLPKFSSGGYVSAPSVASATLAGGRDVIDLNFNIGGASYPVSGDRQTIQGLASALAAMSKGVS